MIPPIIWQYWEGPQTDFISLCHETVAHNCGDFETRLLDQKTVLHWLPELRRDLDRLPQIGSKADYIRFALLHRYGGVWMDSDNVLFRPLEPVRSSLLNSGQTFAAPAPNGLGRPSIGFIMARQNCPIIETYLERANRRLDRGDPETVLWGGLGAAILWKITTPENVLHLDSSRFYPIVCGGYRLYFQDIPPAQHIPDDAYVFMFAWETLQRKRPEFLRCTRSEIFSQSTLMAKIFQRALSPTPER